MKRLLHAACLVIAMSAAAIAMTPATPGWASFTGKCSKYQFPDSNVRRLDAQAYATVGRHEGYEWGGGCWNDNDKDDTPGQPDSNGEGPDCSGFVFKTWELRNAAGDNGFTWYQSMQNVHGDFTSYDFHAPVSSDPFFKLSDKANMVYMDAFAMDGHVGLLSTTDGPTANTDLVMEALNDERGVILQEETYQDDSRYIGVSRENWTADCYPNCKSPRHSVVVVP